MGSPSSLAALRCAAVVLTVAVVIPVASGIAAAREATAVPAKIVGRWSRIVTSSDLERANEAGVSIPTGVWSMVIKQTGRSTPIGAAQHPHPVSRVGSSRLRLDG